MLDINNFFAGIALMFEQKLKNEFRSARNITYDIAELHRFIDSLDDLVCLMYGSYMKFATLVG